MSWTLHSALARLLCLPFKTSLKTQDVLSFRKGRYTSHKMDDLHRQTVSQWKYEYIVPLPCQEYIICDCQTFCKLLVLRFVIICSGTVFTAGLFSESFNSHFIGWWDLSSLILNSSASTSIFRTYVMAADEFVLLLLSTSLTLAIQQCRVFRSCSKTNRCFCQICYWNGNLWCRLSLQVSRIAFVSTHFTMTSLNNLHLIRVNSAWTKSIRDTAAWSFFRRLTLFWSNRVFLIPRVTRFISI